MKTYAMMVLGCKVNDYEATYVRERLNNYYEEISFKQKADVYLIFTCCVTNVAEAKTRKFIHAARRNNPDAYIAAIGCLSQIKPNSEVFKEVDLVIGSDQKDKIVDFVLAEKKANLVSEDVDKEFESLNISSYPTKSRSFLKIEDGCNQFCSFCIIPYARGRERSENHLKIIEEAKNLSHYNKEIVLTGIHTGRYNDGEYNLYDLLKELVKIDGLETIRLSSIEINELTDEIIDLIAQNEKMGRNLHIPVQTCNNTILSSMHRPYTIEEYKDRIKEIRNKIPDLSISTDLIAGFPGETDELFEDTLRNIEEINFSFIHVFPYSRKSGTLADKMDNHLDQKVKKERVKKIIDISGRHYKAYKSRFINKKVKVLIEKNSDGFSYGYCKEYFYIKIKGIYNIGSLTDVIIDSVDEEVIGHVVI